MEQNARNDANDLCKKGIQQLTESLSSLRKAESSYVILVCQDQEFFEHKFFDLQARSPYFQTLFYSGKSDLQNVGVVFKDIEPQTMDAILDFLYLGSVDKFKTPDEVKKVAKAASMMGLVERCEIGCVLSKGTVDQDVRKVDLKDNGINIHTAVADVSAPQNCDPPRDTLCSPSELPSDSLRESCLENLPQLPISDPPNCRRYEKFLRLTARFPKNPLQLLASETRKLYSKTPHKCVYGELLLFLVVFALYTLAFVQMVQHSEIPEDFKTELLCCLKSESENQHGCIKAIFKQYPSTSSLKSRTIRMPGTGLVHFTFNDQSQLKNELPGAKPQFSWKLIYYSDYRNIKSPYLEFCRSWLGKLICPKINTISVEGFEFLLE